jgi:lycopene cyclase domain-containing protein
VSYSGFLMRFLVPPLIVILALNIRDIWRGKGVSPALSGRSVWIALIAHVLVAVAYTTPWDNYLIATEVWWYEPEKVFGLTFGWIPVEEYTFFVLQTLLTGLWWVWLSRHLSLDENRVVACPSWRWRGALAAGLVWLGFALVLVLDWRPGTYLALEFTWSMLPVIVQLAFGADILWHHRKLVSLSILVPTLYLSLADSTAIGAGTWTFSPRQSTGWWVGGIVPVEEILFFLLTNTLISFGMTLVLAKESAPRFRALLGT